MRRLLIFIYILCSYLVSFGQTISEVEYFINTDPGKGNGTSVAFDPANLENINFVANVDGLSGVNSLYVRTKDSNGVWSLATSRVFYINQPSTSDPSSSITYVEYFFDSDPGEGLATPLDLSSGTDVEVISTINVSTLTSGIHTLYVRAMNSLGAYSMVARKHLLVNPTVDVPTSALPIEYVEYFFDSDPGEGNGTALPVTAGNDVTIIENLDVSTLDDGIHKLMIRARNSAGVYSMLTSKVFFVAPAATPEPELKPITYVEYYFDSDPGPGNGTSLPLTSNFDLTLNQDLDVSGLNPGVHRLSIRGRDEKGLYSMSSSRLVYVNPTTAEEPAIEPVTYVEYYFDADPGKGNGIEVPLTASFDLTLTPQVDVSALRPGAHQLYVRAKSGNRWSIISRKAFVVNETFVAPEPIEVTKIEYFVDESPANGTPKTIQFTHGTDVTVSSTLSLNDLDNGDHQIVFRARNNHGFWSYYDTIQFSLTGTLLKGVTTADSLALVALFNSAGGENWTNKENWLAGKVEDWFGISVVERKVTAIVLPGNNLEGSVPEDVVSLNELEAVSLEDNRLTSIPDFSGIQSLASLNVSGNNLDFASLEPNMPILDFSYMNQGQIGEQKTTKIPANESYSVSIETGGTANVYQWYFKGEPVIGANENVLVIDEVNRETMGDYHCEVMSDLVPDLTLTSRTHTLIAVAGVSGKLYADANTPASSGKVTLFRVTQEDGYDTTAIVQVNTDGSYIFEDVVLDDYQLLGFADTLLYPSTLPTYFENTIYWEDADKIQLTQSELSKDIVAIQRPDITDSGNGIIEGYLQEEIDDASGRVMAKKRVSRAGVSIRRTERSSRGKEFELVAYTFTDENGEFKFPDLAPGNYILNIQYPGYPMDPTSDINIVVGEKLDAYQAVEAEVVAEGKIVVRNLIVTSVDDPGDLQVEVFPNPTTDFINLKFAERSNKRKLVILGAQGRVLKHSPASNEQEQIEVRDLTYGIYLLKVEDGPLQRTFRVQITGQ